MKMTFGLFTLYLTAIIDRFSVAFRPKKQEGFKPNSILVKLRLQSILRIVKAPTTISCGLPSVTHYKLGCRCVRFSSGLRILKCPTVTDRDSRDSWRGVIWRAIFYTSY